MTSPDVYDFTKSTYIAGVRSNNVCNDETDFAIIKAANRLTGEDVVCLVTKSRHEEGLKGADQSHLEAVVELHAEGDEKVLDIDVFDPALKPGILAPLASCSLEAFGVEKGYTVDVEGIVVPDNLFAASAVRNQLAAAA